MPPEPPEEIQVKKQYRKRTPIIQAEQFLPCPLDKLPEDVEESLTSGKFWLRNVQNGRMTRSYVAGVPIKEGDYIVIFGKEKVVMSSSEFEETYEEA